MMDEDCACEGGGFEVRLIMIDTSLIKYSIAILVEATFEILQHRFVNIAQDDSVEFDPPRFFQTDLETHRLLGEFVERWVNRTIDRSVPQKQHVIIDRYDQAYGMLDMIFNIIR